MRLHRTFDQANEIDPSDSPLDQLIGPLSFFLSLQGTIGKSAKGAVPQQTTQQTTRRAAGWRAGYEVVQQQAGRGRRRHQATCPRR